MGVSFVKSSVFKIKFNINGLDCIHMGTGFLCKDAIFTAAHVVSNMPEGMNLLIENDNFNVTDDITDVSIDDDLDVAIIKLSKKPNKCINLDVCKEINSLKEGVPVYTLGYCLDGDEGPFFTSGHIAGFHNKAGRWVINGAFNSGNSGGPVFNTGNQVIGLVQSSHSNLINTLNINVIQYMKDFDSCKNCSKYKDHLISVDPNASLEFVSTVDNSIKKSPMVWLAESIMAIVTQNQLVMGYAMPIQKIISRFYKEN